MDFTNNNSTKGSKGVGVLFGTRDYNKIQRIIEIGHFTSGSRWVIIGLKIIEQYIY